MNKKEAQDSIVIYDTLAKGVAVRVSKDTLWLTQKMMADVFETSTDNIGLHLKHIYQEEELMEHSTTEESSVVRKEGKREIKRKVKQYNLDAIIAVGYRVNSKKATQFRRWSTKVLKDHMLMGYTINRQRVKVNYEQFLKAVDDVKCLLPAGLSDSNLALDRLALNSPFVLTLVVHWPLINSSLTVPLIFPDSGIKMFGYDLLIVSSSLFWIIGESVKGFIGTKLFNFPLNVSFFFCIKMSAVNEGKDESLSNKMASPK